MAVEGWRERHGTCRFGTYRRDETDEGLVVPGCANPAVGSRYSEKFCACECPAYHARPSRLPQGRIPVVEELEKQ